MAIRGRHLIQKKDRLVLLGTMVLSVVVIMIANRLVGYWRFTIVSIPFILLGFHFRSGMRPPWRTVFLGLMLALVLVSAYSHVNTMRSSVSHPHEWDFLDFWIAGQTATRGLNIYDPIDYQKIELPFVPSEDFKQEVLTVGLKYPPPSIFIFFPLGFFKFKQALILWYMLQTAFLALSVFLLWKTFAQDHDMMSLAFTAILMMSITASSLTFYFAQTNFMALTMLLLFWLYRHRPGGGFWLCLGMLVKPFLGIFVLYLLIKRRWKIVLAALASLLVCSLLSLIVLGKTTFLTYFLSNPSNSIPDWVYTQWMNQSLLATVLRFTDFQFTGSSPMTNPAFVAVSLILTAVTGFVAHRLDDLETEWGLGLTLLLALIIYPSSMKHYAVMLIVPTALLWTHREEIPFLHWTGVVAFISFGYFLIYRSDLIFFATASFWLLFCFIGIRSAGILKGRQ